MVANILIIDDEKNQRETLAGYLRKQNFDVYSAADGISGIEILNKNLIDIVLTDFKMPDITGIQVLEQIKKINPEVTVVIMTAFGTIEDAVEAMQKGAFTYLQKPVNLDELDLIIERALLQKNLVNENKKLKEELSEKFKFDNIVYQSKVLEEALNIAGRVAKSNAPVLLRGESGTGKELFAKAIHYSSNIKEEPFVVVNCAALPETLIESEMFGHEKGSFTGANSKRIGRFEEAKNGTIFIDEIGDIPLLTQVKLLRVLQSGEFSRVGSNEIIKTNARIVTATNRNLEDMISHNSFREDFYYRINVVTINIPPLRDRKEDISALIDHFLKKYSNEDKQFSREAHDLLLKYSFPGNVRELENIVQRSVVLSRSNLISVVDLPSNIKPLQSENRLNSFEPEVSDINIQIEDFERKIIMKALDETKGNQTKAANLLNISERNLRYKLQKYKGEKK